MNKVLIALGIAIVMVLSACTSLSESDQLTRFASDMRAAGFTVDRLVNAKGEEVLDNSHFEDDSKSHKRKIKNKKVTTKSKRRVAELIVVITGNCRVEFEREKNTTNGDYVLDEFVGQNQNDEIEPGEDTEVYKLKPKDVLDYINSHRNVFDFCINKPLVKFRA